jgi:ArsR family transcriptional regulator, zinc-responsive transcriptional repressor
MHRCAYHHVTVSATAILERFEAASDLFRTLSSPVRLAIVQLLADGEKCVHEIVEALGLPQPLVSQHLRVLRAADLVAGVRSGREVAYVLVDEHVAHIVGDALQHSEEGGEHDPDRAPAG